MLLKQGVLLHPSVFRDVQILTVDNDRDSGALYTALLENYRVTVITTETIQEALNLLNQFVPDIVVCEVRFLGESVHPLIQRVRSIAQDKHKLIPIFVISTCPTIHLTEHLKDKVAAHQIKPIDIDRFVAEVWNLVCLSKAIQPLTIQDWLANLDRDQTSSCWAGWNKRNALNFN